MFRSVAHVVIAALALSAAVHAYVVPSTVSRLIKGDGSDASGVFTVVGPQSDASCPNRIVHRKISAPLPHSQMAMNGKPCNDGGEMTIATDIAAATEVAGANVELINTISGLSDKFASITVGYEEAGRTCTGGGSQVSFPEKTLVVILRPSEAVDVPGVTSMYPRFVYMNIFQEDGTKCAYYAVVRDPSPSPAAAESTSPSPSTSAEGTTTTTPTTPTTSASPSPSTSMSVEEDDEPVESPDSSSGEDDEDSEEGEGAGSGSDGDSEGHSEDEEDEESSSEPTAEPTPESENDDPICFPADATVELEDGSSKKMVDVSVGDRVLVASGEYSDVYMFSHKVADVKNSFVTLRSASGLEISATSGHYLYINGQLAAARTAKTGDSITRADGTSETISAVTIETKTGLYNPQTTHGDIIVNGVRASTFTTTVKHCTAQALLAPIRLVYKALGLSLNVFDNGADKIASLMPKGQSIA